MKQEVFEANNRGRWQVFQAMLDSRDRRPPSPEFPHLYRQVCQHLALAQSRGYRPELVDYLNGMALKGHQALYAKRGGFLLNAARFSFYEFPALVRKNMRLFWLCHLLFYGAMLGVYLTIVFKPALLYSFMPAEQVSEFQAMYDPEAKHFGEERAFDSDFLMFGYYIQHNIGIDFQTFAGGLVAGVGSLFYLIFNGIFLGAAMGLVHQAGLESTFYPFVIGHGSFELTALILSAVAGLKLGLAWISPKRLTRRQALLTQARESIRIVYGVVGFSVIAAALEGFWSSTSMVPGMVKIGVGAILWMVVYGYLMLAGRGHEPG